MLWPTHTINAAHQAAASEPFVTGQSVYLHTRHPNRDMMVQPGGQPLYTFLEDNAPTPPAYRRGDIITITSVLSGAPLPPVTQFTVDDIESRGSFWPYVELQLTATGR